MNRPVPVVGQSFCLPHPVHLEVSRSFSTPFTGIVAVNDADGNLVFKIKNTSFIFSNKRLILDALNQPIVTLSCKMTSTRCRWEVFRGDSTSGKDLIFSARRSSAFQMKNELHVFLANNKSEDVCDYMVRGNWLPTSCKVYAGDSSTIIAQMKSAGTVCLQREMVEVSPDVDNAFIVALIVILDEINTADGRGGGSTVGLNGVAIAILVC